MNLGRARVGNRGGGALSPDEATRHKRVLTPPCGSHSSATRCGLGSRRRSGGARCAVGEGMCAEQEVVVLLVVRPGDGILPVD